MAYKITSKCVLCYYCVQIAPTVFFYDSEAKHICIQNIVNDESTVELLEDARSCCPTGAIIK